MLKTCSLSAFFLACSEALRTLASATEVADIEIRAFIMEMPGNWRCGASPASLAWVRQERGLPASTPLMWASLTDITAAVAPSNLE